MTKSSAVAENRFHPLIRDWFSRKYGSPTAIQEQTWPRVANGESVVVSAPTGSGKTLTAFLAFIDKFIQGELRTGAIRVVYVSPLKALNNDIRRNLLEPLAELEHEFKSAGLAFPTINVLTRSGDTPQSARQRMLRHPPEILVSTPESLLFMLTAARSQRLFGLVQAVVLDEIHALVENRRGSMLMASLERIVDLSGEFQRIALSATVRPLSVVADYVGGYDNNGNQRKVHTVTSTTSKQIELSVHVPSEATQARENGQPIWPHLIEDFHRSIQTNDSTLIFTESRRMAERIASDLNSDADSITAYSHHGSLSREIREEVEARLKAGDLKAIVATSSLEMGIDIGSLDEVLLIQTPMSVSSALQRIGRSGHRVGDVSRAKLYPTHARDLIDSAALALAIEERDIELLQPMKAPLDLLAQLIVSRVVAESCSADNVFASLIRSYSYSKLDRQDFDRVLGMLTGRFEDARIRSLRPRIAIDQSTQKISARKSAAMALYSSGGAIPDRGYYRLRHADTGALIGELDEEYVWEAKIGQNLTFGSQQWAISSISHNDVSVRSAPTSEAAVPFFRSEFNDRDFHFASLVGRFLKTADELLSQDDQPALLELLDNRGFDKTAARDLVELLVQQRNATTVLPHQENLIAEQLASGPGTYVSGASDEQLILHTNWGGRVNRPITMALSTAWRETFRSEPDMFCDNYTIAIQLKQQADVQTILGFLDPDRLDERLAQALEHSGFFGARFRECAGRSLLLNKSRFDQRVPLWMTRMQSKKLLEAAQDYDDFPVLLETWRTCLQDEFDLIAAREVLARLSDGLIEIIVVRNSVPSVFASDISYDQIGRYMYADDSPEGTKSSKLSEELVSAAIRDPSLRPPITANVIEEFELKLQRRMPGYEPEDPLELEEWIKTRVWIPQTEWFEEAEIPSHVEVIEESGWRGLIHAENSELIRNNPTQAVANALQFYGPRTQEEFLALIPLDRKQVIDILSDLVTREILTDDVQVEDEVTLRTCDRENLDALLRLQRLSNRSAVEPVSIRNWTVFCERWQQFSKMRSSADSVVDVVERLRGYSAPIDYWLKDVWLARCNSIPKHELEECLQLQQVCWRGTERERITMGFPDDLAFGPTESQDNEPPVQGFVDPQGQYTFSTLQSNCSMLLDEFNEVFWSAVWRGEISSDSIIPLRTGAERKFRVGVSGAVDGTLRRRLVRRRRQPSRPGTWYRTDTSESVPDSDPIEQLEEAKERVRILLSRYGVVTREIANREGGVFRWRALFDALRIMELSGELTSGIFFMELSGPQFARPDAVHALAAKSQHSVWLSAYDPAAPCGMGVEWPELPDRRVGNYLGFVDGELLCTCTAQGKKLQVFAKPQDERLDRLFIDMPHSVCNGKMVIEEINGLPARSSPFLPQLSRVTSAYSDHARVYIDSQSIR